MRCYGEGALGVGSLVFTSSLLGREWTVVIRTPSERQRRDGLNDAMPHLLNDSIASEAHTALTRPGLDTGKNGFCAGRASVGNQPQRQEPKPAENQPAISLTICPRVRDVCGNALPRVLKRYCVRIVEMEPRPGLEFSISVFLRFPF